MEERGWRSGESTKSRRRYMWVEFVFGSLQYCLESFPHPPTPRVLQFLLFLKTNTSKFQFDLERTDTSRQVLKNFTIFQFTRDIHTLTDHRQMQSGWDSVPCCLVTEFCMKQHSLWQLGRPVMTQREAFRPGCLSVTFCKQRHNSFYLATV